jgi:hypothetical protein
MSGQKPDKPKKGTQAFLIDPEASEGNELPTVSKLLNRKKLLKQLQEEKSIKLERQKDKTLSKPPKLPEATPPLKPLEILKNRRKTKREPLVAWTIKELQTSGDPMGSGLALLFERGITESAVFLALKNTSDGQIFVATAGLNTDGFKNVWDGLNWEPKIFPEIWKVLLTKGYAEFAPESRNINRTAFAIDSKKWLTLIRVGTPQLCRGILAIVSAASLALALEKALPLLFKSPDSNERAS